MASVRRQIEDAVVTALGPMKTASKVRQIRAFSGQLLVDDQGDVKLRTGGQLPALLVTSGSAIYRTLNLSKRRAIYDLQIEVYVVTQSNRTREEISRDDVSGGQIGAYSLMELVHDYLQGLLLSVSGAGRLEPVDEEVIEQEPDFAIWRLRYTVACDMQRPKTSDPVVDDLTSIVSTATIPPPDATDVEEDESVVAQSGSP